VTDTRRQSDWKRWFTSGRAIAIAAVAVVAALAALLTDIKTIVTAWDDLFMPRLQSHDINMRDLVVIATHRADLYVLKNRQDVERFVGRTLPPAETGYVAQLEFVVEKKSDAPRANCVAKALPKSLWHGHPDPVPPQDGPPWEGPDGSIDLSHLSPWVGVDSLWVGYFRRGPDERSVPFEVFFRDEKRFLGPKDELLWVRLACEDDPDSLVRGSAPTSVPRITGWVKKEISAPDKTVTPYVRIRLELPGSSVPPGYAPKVKWDPKYDPDIK